MTRAHLKTHSTSPGLFIWPQAASPLPRRTDEYALGRAPCLRPELLRLARSGVLR
jgi:hypothetical protein